MTKKTALSAFNSNREWVEALIQHRNRLALAQQELNDAELMYKHLARRFGEHMESHFFDRAPDCFTVAADEILGQPIDAVFHSDEGRVRVNLIPRFADSVLQADDEGLEVGG